MTKQILLSITAIFAFLSFCGTEEKTNHRSSDSRLWAIEQKLLMLKDQLGSLSQSDFSNCDPALDDTVESICRIAQASSLESQVKIKAELTQLTVQLESKLNDSQRDVSTLSTAWVKIYGVDFPATSGAPVPSESECYSFTGSASVIGCIMVLQSAIDTLQAAVVSLSTPITGYMTPIDIGSENISAGPVYEQVIRMVGGNGRINAFVDGKSPPYSVGLSPINATNGSPIATITTSTNHGLTVNDRITMESCFPGRGWTSQQLTSEFIVLSVPTATTFTVAMTSNATSGGNLGGNSCIIQKFTGYGFKTIWTNSDPSDSAIRTTSGGSKSYNFAVCKTTGNTGIICYDSSNKNANFATVSSITGWSSTCLGEGNIVCK